MKVQIKPKVYLVGYQQVSHSELSRFYQDENLAEYISDAPSDSEALVEYAGRLDYMSYNKRRPGGNKAYISNLLNMHHGSPLEMAVYSFIITGVSRSCIRDFLRHRTMSPSELSQRYVDLEELDVEVIEPQNIADDPELHDLWQGHQKNSRVLYKQFADKLFITEKEKYLRDKFANTLSKKEETDLRKLARQSARSLLTEGTGTKIFITVNARCLRNIFELRCSRYASVEIRVMTNMLFDIVSKFSPNLFADYEKVTLDDGTFETSTPNRKV